MNTNEKQLSVRMHGEHIGLLKQIIHGKLEFTYDANAKQPISLSLPLREEPYDAFSCEAFFVGLLPESEIAKRAIGRRYGISPYNTFALLKVIGYDCAGALSFHPLDEAIKPQRVFPLEGKLITESELYQQIKALPEKPLFLGFEGLRLSLAGVQEKTAVCLLDNKIAIPQSGCPTTHILKPASLRHIGIVENEFFCMKLASNLGLNIPQVEIRYVKDISYLLIERYDRIIHNNQVERIHQEDFCQALNISPNKKYQNEGGPSFKVCFELLKVTSQPAITRNQLATALIFNFLIGNMDAHGKNFSLLHKTLTTIQLTPFYDLLCTRIYSSLTSKMAMKIGSKYIAEQVLPRHWKQLCNDISYSYPAIKKLIRKLGSVDISPTAYVPRLVRGIQ